MASASHRISVHGASMRRPAAARLARIVFLSVALATVGHAQEQPWRTMSSNDGIRMEARRVAGARFDELRVSTVLEASPDAVADYLFGKYLDARNRNISRSFIRRDPEVAIWSDVLDTPVVSQRCYSMRFDRQAHPDGGIRVKFASLDYAGKEAKPGCIALHSRGEWTMTPTTAGTRLTYTSLTDIGGQVPMFLARRSLAEAAISSVRKVVAGASGLPLPRGMGD
jgi:hypothetical protein